jgi:hypothetical protein
MPKAGLCEFVQGAANAHTWKLNHLCFEVKIGSDIEDFRGKYVQRGGKPHRGSVGP